MVGASAPNVERSAISAKIFVGNLSYDTTEPQLREFLGQAGTIVDLYLATDRETGRPRGFAFATYSTEAEAADAIQRFNGQELGGRALNINEAQERPRRPRMMDVAEGPFEDFSFGGSKRKPFKAKGSRRGLRARKRSL
jgi:RNA recognition motif-containing protein